MGKVGWHRARGLSANSVRAASILTLTIALGVVERSARAEGGGQRAPAQPAAAHAPGDCKGALDAYDRAINATIDPVLRRDRGLCHEQLGHPFPAIDDYRYYLTNRPNAPDAENVRARLTRLEEEVGVGGRSARTSDEEGASASAEGSIALKTANGSAAASTGKPRDLDMIERDEKLDADADASPLRRGKGFVIGLSIGVARFTKEAFGWTELAALDLRYSLSPVSSLLLDFGYAHVNSSGNASSLGGATVTAGYEARIALNPRVNDALLLGATFAYEHLAQPASGLVFTTFIPQARFGYRHVLGPALGLEAAFDGGLAVLHLTGAPAGADANTTSAIFGGHVALVLGF